MDILKLNKITNQVEFVVENFIFIPEFAELYKRTTAVKDDESGSKRKLNYMELRYVFHLADWSEENYIKALPDKQRHDKAMHEAKLTTIIGWKPDIVVKKCIAKYEEIQQTLMPTARYLIAAERSLMQAAQYLETLTRQNEGMASKLDAMSLEIMSKNGDELQEGLNLLTSANELYAKNIKQITDTIANVDKAEDRIATLRKKVTSEYIKNREVIGGGKPHNREIPNSY